ERERPGFRDRPVRSADPGAVDDGVDRSEAADRGVERGVDLGLARHVGGREERMVAETFCDGVAVRARAVDDDGAAAALDDGPYGGLAQSRGAAGHESNAV